MSSNFNIVTIKEMIALAFGEKDQNTVNFKLIEAVLYILARQLHLLERRVGVHIGFVPILDVSSSQLSVTEVKVFAKVPKKKRKKRVLEDEEVDGPGHQLLRRVLSSRATIIQDDRKRKLALLAEEEEEEEEDGKKLSPEEIARRAAEKAAGKKGKERAGEDAAGQILRGRFAVEGEEDEAGGLERGRKGVRDLEGGPGRGERGKGGRTQAELDEAERHKRKKMGKDYEIDEEELSGSETSDMEITEKLLILERKGEIRAPSLVDEFGRPIPNFVTREQYDKLLGEIKDLETLYGPIDWKTLTIENKEVIKKPDANMALELSERLKRAERALDAMENMISGLIKLKRQAK